MYARPLGQNTMMTGVPTRFRELSVCNQAEGFLSPAGRGDFCVKLLLSNLSDWLEAKFWLLPGKLDRRRLNWFLFLKINLFLEKMWDVLKGSSTANRQLWQVTATSDIILLVFTKRPQAPNTCSWSPGLTCLFTVCWPSFKQQRSQMSVLRLQSSTWEAEVGISKSRRLVWATEQNPVSKCQKQTNKQTNWRLDSNDQIVRIKPTSRKLYTGGGGGEAQTAVQWETLCYSIGTSLAQHPSESCSGYFHTMPYFYHKTQGQNHQLWKPEHLESSFKETP